MTTVNAAALGVLAAVLLAGCGSRPLLPTVEEEAVLIANANLDRSTHFAVVTRERFASRDVADTPIAQPLVKEIAEITEELLDIQATALDQSRNGEWARELVESWDEAGFFETIDHIDFFAERGFDGYIVAMPASTGQTGGFMLGQQTPERDRVDATGERVPHSESFAPQFRIYVFENGEEIPIMRSGKDRTLSCDKVSQRVGSVDVIAAAYADADDCAQKFSSLYREYLADRLPAK